MENVDNGPRNSLLIFGDIAYYRGALTFGRSKVKAKGLCHVGEYKEVTLLRLKSPILAPVMKVNRHISMS